MARMRYMLLNQVNVEHSAMDKSFCLFFFCIFFEAVNKPPNSIQ